MHIDFTTDEDTEMRSERDEQPDTLGDPDSKPKLEDFISVDTKNTKSDDMMNFLYDAT